MVQSLELNLRTITQTTTQGSRNSAPLINPRLLPMPCHNHTLLTSPDKDATASNHNATSIKRIEEDHAYPPHPPFMHGIQEKAIPNDITITYLPQVKHTLHSRT
jgi:hypothetical protein